MKRILITLGIMLVAIFVWADQMPDFRLPDMNDKNVSLESLLEKGPVLIDFWADYCKPCKEAMPHLNTLAEKYKTSPWC
jgi:thiol-disulfide isomerase/thioredoxin